MADFERFLTDNNLKKIDVANCLQVSKAFITQLCQGRRRLPPEKFALLNSKGWDTTALLEDAPASTDNSNHGAVTTIGDISGITNSPTTVNNGNAAELLRVIESQEEQIRAQHEQIRNLTDIIRNLTSK